MVQSQLNTARLIAIDRMRDELIRVANKIQATYQNLIIDNTIPNPVPRPSEWTNSQLDDLLRASLEVLAQILIVENSIKFDIILLDKEKVSRRP